MFINWLFTRGQFLAGIGGWGDKKFKLPIIHNKIKCASVGKKGETGLHLKVK